MVRLHCAPTSDLREAGSALAARLGLEVKALRQHMDFHSPFLVHRRKSVRRLLLVPQELADLRLDLRKRLGHEQTAHLVAALLIRGVEHVGNISRGSRDEMREGCLVSFALAFTLSPGASAGVQLGKEPFKLSLFLLQRLLLPILLPYAL